jgi:choline dehydrogenase-like flavoprotein
MERLTPRNSDGNVEAPVIMIGEKAADRIREDEDSLRGS